MTDTITLPPLDDDRVSAIEARVFRSIGTQRAARALRRRRTATVGGVAAGLIALAVVVGPLVGEGPAVTGSASSAAGSAAQEGAPVSPESRSETAPLFEQSGGAAADGSADAATRGDAATREVVSTASTTLEVAAVPDAIAAITATASDLGGYVESSSTSGAPTSSGAVPGDGAGPADSAVRDDAAVPGWVPEGAGVISIRVPADRLAEARDSLSGLGTVTASSVDRRDVTTAAIDLRARVDAAQTSVDRLTALVGQAANLADLLAAESALAERQASLESYQQQLTALESQVSLATVTVTVLPESAAASAEPTGFLDGLLAGWNGLVAAANGALIGAGFLLPWLAVAAVIGLIVVAVRRRRGPPKGAPDTGSSAAGE